VEKNVHSECENIIDEISSITDHADAKRIEQVASDLERTHYEPIFLFPVEQFLRMTKAEVISEAQRIRDMDSAKIEAWEFQHRDDPEKVRVEQLNMLKRNYHLLARLRADEPEAWDEVHELYEDD
jgi:hypothetical protein